VAFTVSVGRSCGYCRRRRQRPVHAAIPERQRDPGSGGTDRWPYRFIHVSLRGSRRWRASRRRGGLPTGIFGSNTLTPPANYRVGLTLNQHHTHPPRAKKSRRFSGSGGSILRTGPTRFVSGPDGALWFTTNTAVDGADRRVTTDGQITTSVVGWRMGPSPLGLALGPTANVWYTPTTDRRPCQPRPRRALTFTAPPPGFLPSQHHPAGPYATCVHKPNLDIGSGASSPPSGEDHHFDERHRSRCCFLPGDNRETGARRNLWFHSHQPGQSTASNRPHHAL